MLNLKTKVQTETEVEINLETPAFYKDKSGYYFLGVIEECVINIFHIEGMRTWLSNDSVDHAKNDIIKAYQNWEHISEEEFFENLDKALKDFNFKPSMRVINAKEGSEVTI